MRKGLIGDTILSETGMVYGRISTSLAAYSTATGRTLPCVNTHLAANPDWTRDLACTDQICVQDGPETAACPTVHVGNPSRVGSAGLSQCHSIHAASVFCLLSSAVCASMKDEEREQRGISPAALSCSADRSGKHFIHVKENQALHIGV